MRIDYKNNGEQVIVCENIQDNFILEVLDKYFGPNCDFDKLEEHTLKLHSCFSILLHRELNRNRNNEPK